MNILLAELHLPGDAFLAAYVIDGEVCSSACEECLEEIVRALKRWK